MKRLLLFALLMLSIGVIAQNTAKLSDELQNELSVRTAAHEQFRIIIIMAEEYDQNMMARQIEHLDKENRRTFVIDELKRFAEGSQASLMATLQEGVKEGTVKELNPFWIFNGISCVTDRETIAALAKRQDIAFIESDEIRNRLPEEWNPVKAEETTRALAWHVSQVHADQVWSQGYTGSGVVVAILDTGVNYNHVNLADHMWDGGSSYPHHGYDFVNNDNDPIDDHGHGSHCAGITAGDGTSGTNTGIAPDATIMALKVLSANGSGSDSGIHNAEQFAMQQGADVVSMSLGAGGASGNRTDRQIFVNMMNAGIVASIAAGNEGENYSSNHPDPDGYYYPVPRNVGSPGNCPPPWHNPDQTLTGGHSAVVTVGASQHDDCKSTFSSFGPVTWSGVSGYNDYPYEAGNSTNIGLIKPDVIAPGSDILSCDYEHNSALVVMAGTSMATPLVSGIMALMLQANPNLTPAQIDEFLETSALPVEYRVTKNNCTGAGRADALAAIDAILTQATKPTNLGLETCGGNVNLSWTASTAPAGYCIYRDNVQVGTTMETTYTDENVGAGKHVYYVRANDNNGHQSVHSNALVCTIQPYATIPENLTLSWDGTNADLEWDASTVSNTLSQSDLYYTNSNSGYLGSNSPSTAEYWGVRYLPEDLRAYVGMSIDQVQFYAPKKSVQYTLRIYRGSEYGNTTGTPVLSKSTTPSSTGWQTLTFTNPYAINDISEDLWITVSAKSGIPVSSYSGNSSNVIYVGDQSSANEMVWFSYHDFGYHYAVSIKAHLTRTTTYTPTYNVYLDNSSEAINLSVTDYTDTPTLHSGDNTYYVTAKVGNNESCPSNDAKIVVVDNTRTENNLAIDESLVYLVEDGGTLNVNGNLTNTDPERLILEDGAQLVNNSTGVQATVKKNIAAYTDEGGWYTIATPFASYDPATVLATDAYDLYAYDEDGDSNGKEWINYKAGAFNLTAGNGYLYAHNPGADLAMTGTLNSGSYSQNVTLSYANEEAPLKGFNLLGNPTSHDISFTKTSQVADGYYYLDNGDAWTYTTETTVPAGRGFLVKANATGQSVVLNPQSKGDSGESGHYLRLAIGGDNAYLKLDEGVSMPLLDLKGRHGGLYFTQEHKSYVMLVRNGADSVDLCYEPTHNGTQTLTVDLQGHDLDYLHLIDTLTGADIDLLVPELVEGPATYTFEAKTTDYPSRFRLVFSASVPEPVEGPNQPFAYLSHGDIIVNGEGTVQVIDMLGRVIVCRDAINRVSTNGFVPGVYVIRLIDGENVKTQKVVVR